MYATSAQTFLSRGYFRNGLNIRRESIDTRLGGKVFRLGKDFHLRRQARLA